MHAKSSYRYTGNKTEYGNLEEGINNEQKLRITTKMLCSSGE